MSQQNEQTIAPAYKAYLLNIPRGAAVQHVYECLAQGADGGEAWVLMEMAHGEGWACKPEKLGDYINEAIEGLRGEAPCKGSGAPCKDIEEETP